MPKRTRLSREMRKAAVAARLEMISEETEEKEDEVSDTSEYESERSDLSQKKAEARRENRQSKRQGAQKLRKLELEDTEEEKPCKIVSEHYYVPGEMVKLRRSTEVGLVLDTTDRVLSYHPCGSPREIAKCETVQVLVSGEIITWKSRFLLPVH